MRNSSIKKYYIISYTSYNFPYNPPLKIINLTKNSEITNYIKLCFKPNNPPKYFKQSDDLFLIDQETGELIHHITPQTFDFNKESYI